MRIIKKSLPLLLISLSLVFSGLNSCKNPTENLDLIIDIGTSETTFGIRFYDAKTKLPVGKDLPSNQQVKVIIEGQNKDYVYASDGSFTYKVDDGFLSLYIRPDIIPSESNVLKFKIVCSAAGYLTSSQDVVVAAKGGMDIGIPMVSITDPPEGVTLKDTTIVVPSSGILQQSITVTTDAAPSSQGSGSASVLFPAGTKMVDNNGAIVSGNVSITFAYFNPLNEASAQAFPGGYSVTTADNQDIVFSSAGFVALELENSNGKKVKTFSNPSSPADSVILTINIPEGTKDQNGNTVQAGGLIPFWSFNTENGSWQNEGNALVVNPPGGSTQSQIRKPISHLSYWNLDYFWNACPVGARIRIEGNPNPGARYVVFYNAITGSVIKEKFVDLTENDEIQLLNVPYSAPMRVKVFDYNCFYGPQSIPVGEVEIYYPCSGVYPLVINSSLGTPTDNVSLTISLFCPNQPNAEFRPTLPFWVLRDGGCNANYGWEFLGTMVNGNFSTSSLKIGESYHFSTYYDGTWYDLGYLPVTQNTYVFNQELDDYTCQRLN